MQTATSQLKKFSNNSIGISAVFINFFFAIWGLYEKGWDYRSFHYVYEPLSIQLLTVINLFAISLAESLDRKFFPTESSQFGYVRCSDFEMILIVIFTIFQWLLIGYVLSFLLQNIQGKLK